MKRITPPISYTNDPIEKLLENTTHVLLIDEQDHETQVNIFLRLQQQKKISPDNLKKMEKRLINTEIRIDLLEALTGRLGSFELINFLRAYDASKREALSRGLNSINDEPLNFGFMIYFDGDNVSSYNLPA